MPAERRTAFAVVLLLACVALGLRIPVLTTPFFADDLVQLTYLASGDSGSYSFRGELDLFRFLDGEAGSARSKMSRGDLPWRFDEAQKLAFFRPVSSLFMWLDQALFGTRSLPAHVHSLLWFVLYCGVLYRLYAYLLPARACVAATFVAILSPATIMTVMWWCDRYALLVAVFAATSLLFHHRWCTEGRARNLVLSLAALALSLGSAESGIQTLPFLFAYTVVYTRGALAATVLRLAPATAVLVVYLAALFSLGYGVEGSALYVNPLNEPGEYLQLLASRIHVGLTAALLADESSTSLMLAAAVAGVSLPLLRLATAQGRAFTSPLVWLALGSLLALLPCFSGRNAFRPWTFVIPQIGLHAILGLLIAAAWRPGASLRNAPVATTCSAFLGGVFWLLPVHTHWQAGTLWKQAREGPTSLRRHFSPEVRAAITPETRRLILLRAPVTVMPVGRLDMWHGIAHDERLTTLVVSDTGGQKLAEGDLVLRRTDVKTLLAEASMPLVKLDDVFRFGSRVPFAASQSIALGDFTVTVREVRDGRPMVVEFAFDRPLDGPEYVLATWSDRGYELVQTPAVGESVSLR